MNGKFPYIYPRYEKRSYIEGELVKIMKRCWAFDADKRPSIFDIVRDLRRIQTEAKHPKPQPLLQQQHPPQHRLH